jgi:protease IV
VEEIMKIHTATGVSRRLLLIVALVLVTAGLQAQSPGSADPFSLWEHTENPAAWGLSPDAMALGFRAGAEVSLLDFVSNSAFDGVYDLAWGIPGFLYRYANDGSSDVHELTSSMALGKALAFGLRFNWDSSLASQPVLGSQDLGLILRPSRSSSFAFELDDAFDAAGDGFSGLDLGLSLRPFAFNPRLESMLTLSADFSYSDAGISFDTAGVRFLLDRWMSVHGRWSFNDNSLGLGLTLAFSGLETAAGMMLPDSGAPLDSGVVSLAQSVRFGLGTKSVDRIAAKAVLLIDEPGSYAGIPPWFDFGKGMVKTQLWFGQALAAIGKAAADPSIQALVMMEPPLFETDAKAQEFGRALERFRKAGKPVYVYATSLDRLSYVYAASGAEFVALDPNGMLPIVDVSSFSLYLKGLFDKLGIDVYNLQSHETKTALNMFSEDSITPAERAMKERYVGGLARQAYFFLDAARGPRLAAGSAAKAIGAGPYLDPRRAVEAGLVDKLMYREEFDDKLDELTKGAPLVDIRTYARESDLSWGDPIGKRAAVVYLSGSIIEGKGVAGISIGDSAAELLAVLREDRSLAGVILRVDSGGGSALTSDHIAREVKLLREAGKKVIVSMAGFAASGGYYISANADRIFAEAGTLTGSIGVVSMDLNATRMLDKLGVGAGIVSAGESGAFGNPFLPRRAGDAAEQEAYIDYVYGRFVDVVAEGRKMDRAKVDELGKGQIWLGSEAKANGLIDELGGLDDTKAAMEKLLGSKAVYGDFVPGAFDTWMFADMIGGAALESMVGTLRAASDLAAMGDGLLYLAPEYLYRIRP